MIGFKNKEMNCNIPQTWKGKYNFFFIYKIKILRSLIYIYSRKWQVECTISRGNLSLSAIYIYIYIYGRKAVESIGKPIWVPSIKATDFIIIIIIYFLRRKDAEGWNVDHDQRIWNFKIQWKVGILGNNHK